MGMERSVVDSPGIRSAGLPMGVGWGATLAVATLLLVCSPAPGAAQAGGLGLPADSAGLAATGSGSVVTVTGPEGRTTASRSELEQRLKEFRERAAGADDWSETEREVHRQAVEQLERRLELGDFRPGDVLAIRVPRAPEVSGKVVVGPDRSIQLPGFEGEEVDLSGLLYSEAADAVREAVTTYVRAERVEVQPLIRVAVLGAVGRPGYYDVAPTVPMAEIIMAAGGPSGDSDLEEVEVRRGETNLLEGRDPDLTRITLLDISARQGDQVVIPTEDPGFSFQTVATVIGTLGGVVWGLSRIF